jgi:uncharacterized protein (DUF433 family)
LGVGFSPTFFWDNLFFGSALEESKCGGRPCIRGKRIRVCDILELLGSGASFKEILEDYPFLERDDINASLFYAAQ